MYWHFPHIDLSDFNDSCPPESYSYGSYGGSQSYQPGGQVGPQTYSIKSSWCEDHLAWLDLDARHVFIHVVLSCVRVTVKATEAARTAGRIMRVTDSRVCVNAALLHICHVSCGVRDAFLFFGPFPESYGQSSQSYSGYGQQQQTYEGYGQQSSDSSSG